MSRSKPKSQAALQSGRMRMTPARSPGTGRGRVVVHPRAPEPPPATLSDALQDAVEAVVVGELMRPSLLGTAKTAAQQVLYRFGIRDGRVQVAQQGAGLALTVVLPAGPQRVERVVLQLGVGTGGHLM